MSELQLIDAVKTASRARVPNFLLTWKLRKKLTFSNQFPPLFR